MSALSPTRVTPPGPDRLTTAIARATTAASWWREQTPMHARPGARPEARGEPPHLLSVPDIGLACEVLLAD
ncbi:MAG: hypothetical protein JNK56_08665, partial [Myxococcales bacterium]|nr:hypothetical protein [Myxococcales bacterium]